MKTVTGERSNHRTTLNAVTQFMKAMDQPINIKWNNKTAKLRFDLLLEELNEVKEAISYVSAEQVRHGKPSVIAESELLKELCDLQYVLDGFFATFGYLKEPAFNRVHSSNMSKLDDDGNPIYREDGKVLKGPNYKPPYLADLLTR
jgi:predicted HAD superfamily Cof-like phosphohydrolase